MRHTHYGIGLTLQKNVVPSAFNVAVNYFWARDFKNISVAIEDAAGYSFGGKAFYNSFNADIDLGIGILPGVSFNTYTDFKTVNNYFTPMIGIGSYAFKVFYGYNISLNSSPNFHAIGLVVRPQILFNAWINADSGLSLYDVRKKKKKRLKKKKAPALFF